jgi:hypothetical protein
MENKLTKIGSKWPKTQRRRSEVRENESLNEKIEEDISTSNMDRGQLNKRKNLPMDALDHLVEKKER